LSEKLLNARREARLTIQQLAQRSGLSRATIINYEKGRRIPRVDDLQKIASATGREAKTLLPNPPQPPDASTPEEPGAERKTA
jgi:transcriptional regulator with XRE-family HTH domain